MKKNKKLTYEFCEKEARKYTTLKEFRENSESAYIASLKNKWNKNYTWLKTRSDLVKWNKITVEKEARKFEFLKDFAKISPGAYKKSLKMGWIENFTWLKRKIHDPSKKLWSVYVYEIKEIYAYIGLTINLDNRDYDHRTRIDKDILAKFCYNNKIVLKKNSYILIAKNLTASEAQKLEDEIKNKYINSGKWIVINSGKTGIGTGSLGSGVQKWDEEACYTAAKQCTTKNEFKKKFPRAYNVSHKNNWFGNYDWFIEKPEIKRVIQYDLKGNFIREYPINNPENYSKHLINKSARKNSRNKTAYGFIWRFKEDVLGSNGEIIKKLDI